MAIRRRRGAAHVVGYDGNIITVADLPPRNTARWVASRKAVVVAAVNGGLISLEEACLRYHLSTEEFFSWQIALDRFGIAGLRATRREPE